MSEQWVVRPPSAASSVRQRFDIYAGETFVARCHGRDAADRIVADHDAALRLAAADAEIERWVAALEKIAEHPIVRVQGDDSMSYGIAVKFRDIAIVALASVPSEPAGAKVER